MTEYNICPMNPIDRVRIHALVAMMKSPDAIARRIVRVPDTLDGQSLDLTTRLFLTLLKLDTVEHHLLPVATQRAEIELAERAFASSVRDVEIDWIDVPLLGRTLHLRTYAPRGAGTTGALLYIHGGGFVTGSAEAYDTFCSRMAEAAACRVFSVEYRLAPEHIFPAAVDDILDTYRWLRERAGALGFDPARLAVGGDSAGGNLSAVLCNLLRPDELPAFQLLLYPGTDMVGEAPSRIRYANGFYLTSAHVRWFYETYVPDPAMRNDPRASPLLATAFGRVRAVLVLAGLDPLVDEGRAYGVALSEAGVPVEIIEVPGMVHGFVSLDGILPAADAAVARICEAVRRRIT